MEQVIEFLTQLGEVFVGLIAAVIAIIVIVVLFIELVDFLIVDPISRRSTNTSDDDEKENV